jgi:glycosyltransferase involved in cell wall biosynthesis
LIDTVGDGGILIEGNNFTKQYQDEFIETSIKLLNNDSFREEWSEKSYKKMQEYKWDVIADNWIKGWNLKDRSKP